VGLISLVSVSPALLVFSAPVLWIQGLENSIFDAAIGTSPQFASGGGPAVSVPITAGWTSGPPPVGDPWAMVPPLTIFTPAAPATGFANSAGLVLA
jgi:hypothetical protein